MERNNLRVAISATVQDTKTRNFLKIKLPEIRILKNSRWELIATLGWVLLPIIFGPLSWILLLVLIRDTEIGKYLAIGYLIWMYVDKESCERGGRRWNWLRRLTWWNYYRDYFPVSLVKTVDLPPDKNYLFAVYPHGILSSGAFAAFSTEALNFEKIFSGLKTYLCTLRINFHMPFIREIALAMGLISASRDSLNWILSSPGKGRAAVLIVGGATEALYSQPGKYKIFLKNRKGFCRIALQNGSSLVPVFSFGEIDLYHNVIPKENTWFYMFQRRFKKLTGIAPVLFFGTGVFNSHYGFIPKRVPVNVVVGEPIEVERVGNPTEEQVNELHSKFMSSIIKLFNEQKHKYLEDTTTELIID